MLDYGYDDHGHSVLSYRDVILDQIAIEIIVFIILEIIIYTINDRIFSIAY